MPVPGQLAVVMPVRNEEQLLPAALLSVRAAVRSLRQQCAARSTVTVVLDSCTDGSADVVARLQRDWSSELDLQIVAGSFGTVGASRAAGIAALPPLPGLWIANTDADTVVPPNWLFQQHALAAAGYGLVLGTAVPEPADLSREEYAAWKRRHTLAEGHPHIHGANLGFTAAAYRKAGGFAPLAAHEDVDLVARIKAAGTPWIATDRIRVVTSGRRDGRAPEGFSRYLSQLLRG
ncbi:glycosyltransferase [Arthrobacter jiangjiafuii]|uniref:4,4'-diaponeurosporenoate glycosyltransferase n=1 Tax=Arthrobacter jiangjiafuii TaxID=2817475 RepID=A0A975QZQ0_9MICC|nr:glycosyltransferase [Arthrobacter jiangjiafuii]MBP3042091.1 glycosyltransferase [Arthrobacter jiangjiafuii]QWC10130.1 glycosyltransferase [Arthrobacter jiangjiafuii]